MKNLKAFALTIGLVLTILATQAMAGPLVKPVSKVPEAQKLIDQAWDQEKIDSNAKIFKACIDLLEKANKLDPNNDLILTELARYYWEYGDKSPKETADQKKFLEANYAKGQAYAEQSVKLKETVAGKYWWCTNRASGLEFSSIFAQAAAFPALKKTSDWVTDHDADYFYGAPGRLWSEILCRVPPVVVKMVGWNVQEAIDQINAAIKVAPGYLDNYLYKARFYHVYFKDDKTALELMDYELKQDVNTVLPTEVTRNKVSQRDAKALWKKITGKDYPNK
jgi:tetratricopeptide (TPR) repeat protein